MTECYQNTIRRRRRFSQRNIVLLFVFLGVLLPFISVLPSRSLCKGNFRTVVRLHARLVRHCSDEVQGDTARCAQVCFGCEWFGKLKRGRDARDGVSSLPQGSRDLLALVVEVFRTELRIIHYSTASVHPVLDVHPPTTGCMLSRDAPSFMFCRVSRQIKWKSLRHAVRRHGADKCLKKTLAYLVFAVELTCTKC